MESKNTQNKSNKQNKQRCNHELIDKITKRKRHCRKFSPYYYCKSHEQDITVIDEDYFHSYCCFCGDECNPCSQACGRCIRKISLVGRLYDK